MDTASPKSVRILFWCASLAHFVGAMEVFAYNLLLRRALGSTMASPVVHAAMIFIGTTALLGALVGRTLSHSGLLKDKSPLFLPLARAALSAGSWLLSIPVLAVVTIKVQGHVNPVAFPHFVASVLIACLISIIYSSLCNLWIALKLAPDTARRPEFRPLVEAFARRLPLFASLVPLVTTATYLFLFRPWTLLPGASKPLEMLLVTMIGFGCYGTLLVRWASGRILHEVRPLQTGSASVLHKGDDHETYRTST